VIETVREPMLVLDGGLRVRTANRDGAASLVRPLTLLGNDTRTAHDGPEGVEMAEAYRPDLTVLDIRLPKLNGYDACRRIRAQPWARDVVIVAATGWGQDEDRRRSLEAGFDHHLVKPVDAAEVIRLLRVRR
jgi:CheY-like chemotaxis protein